MNLRVFLYSLGLVFVAGGLSLRAQSPDSRIWSNNLQQISFFDGGLWIEVPAIAKQSGFYIQWPAVRGFSPNINALFHEGTWTIQEYRAASLSIYAQAGWKILRERILYDRIWEVESVHAVFGVRNLQRLYKTENGVVAITATARSKDWRHASVTQMLAAMRTLMVYY